MAEDAAETTPATETALAIAEPAQAIAERIAEPVKKPRKPRAKKAEAAIPAVPKRRGRPPMAEEDKVSGRGDKTPAIFLADYPSLDIIEAFVIEQGMTRTTFLAKCMNRFRISLGMEPIFNEEYRRLFHRKTGRKERDPDAKVAPSRIDKGSVMAFFPKDLVRKHNYLISQVGISCNEAHIRGAELLLKDHGIEIQIARIENPRKGGRKHV